MGRAEKSGEQNSAFHELRINAKAPQEKPPAFVSFILLVLVIDLKKKSQNEDDDEDES
jgi:hypothetical protein